MKRLLSLIVSLVAITILSTLSASAQSLSYGDWEYTEEGVITDYLGSASYLTVPAELNGTAITKIGEGAFLYCDSLVVVTVSSGIETIGDWAFADCRELYNISLPSSVTSIGSMAFWQSSKLSTITINRAPDSVMNAPWGAGYDSNYYKTSDVTITWTGVATVEFIAQPSSSTLIVDGEIISIDAYHIGDNNYFKLRDIASLVSGTDKEFSVSWDEINLAISLVSGESYSPVGGELSLGDGTAKAYTSTTGTIYINSVATLLDTYNIADNNFFKLRDLGVYFDFNVSWDEAQNAIIISTEESYTAD